MKSNDVVEVRLLAMSKSRVAELRPAGFLMRNLNFSAVISQHHDRPQPLPTVQSVVPWTQWKSSEAA